MIIKNNDLKKWWPHCWVARSSDPQRHDVFKSNILMGIDGVLHVACTDNYRAHMFATDHLVDKVSGGCSLLSPFTGILGSGEK